MVGTRLGRVNNVAAIKQANINLEIGILMNFIITFALFVLALPLAAQKLVTSFEQTHLRSDYTGPVGMKFMVGNNPVTVNGLGRLCVAGNAASHTVQVVTAVGTSIGASVLVPMAGCIANQFVYASIAPVTLSAGSTYYLASTETAGGDQWWEQGTVSLSGASIVSAIYQYNGAWYAGSANSTYGPVSLQYGGQSVILPPAPVGVSAVLGPNQCTMTSPGTGIVKVICLAETMEVHDETDNIGYGSSVDGSWVFTNGTVKWSLSPGTGTAVNYSITNGGTPKTGTF